MPHAIQSNSIASNIWKLLPKQWLPSWSLHDWEFIVFYRIYFQTILSTVYETSKSLRKVVIYHSIGYKWHTPLMNLWNIKWCHFFSYWMQWATVYPKKYAHGFVGLCFVVVMQSFIMNSHEVFIHIHQGCFAGTGAIVRLPQCQWSKPDGYGKISQCITTTKHSKAKTVCIFLGIYCTQSVKCVFHTTKTSSSFILSINFIRTICVQWRVFNYNSQANKQEFTFQMLCDIMVCFYNWQTNAVHKIAGNILIILSIISIFWFMNVV